MSEVISQKFPKKLLTEELGLPYAGVLADEMIDHRRWSITHQIIFEHDGKYWMTHYDEGATEYQDERPWEDDDEVECFQVESKEVMVKKWVPVKA